MTAVQDNTADLVFEQIRNPRDCFEDDDGWVEPKDSNLLAVGGVLFTNSKGNRNRVRIHAFQEDEQGDYRVVLAPTDDADDQFVVVVQARMPIRVEVRTN